MLWRAEKATPTAEAGKEAMLRRLQITCQESSGILAFLREPTDMLGRWKTLRSRVQRSPMKGGITSALGLAARLGRKRRRQRPDQ